MAVIGTFGSFTAARLGIYASQSSLNVTGNNIANINTKGYTRQRMDLVSLHSWGTGRYANKMNHDIGYGVLCDSVSQLRDPFMDIRYRNEQSNVGASETWMDCLQQLAHVLDEVGDGDDFGVIEKQFNEFVDKLQQLKGNVGTEEYDTIVRANAEVLCNLFNNYSKALDTVENSQLKNLQDDVTSVNTILTQIRDLNAEIREAGIHGAKALELRDARNVLIDELSTYIKIDVSYDLEKIDEFNSVERLNINLADSGNPPTRLICGIFGTQLEMPDTAPMRNPAYNFDNPNDPKNAQMAAPPAGGKYVATLDADGNPATYTNNPVTKAMAEAEWLKTHDDLKDMPTPKEPWALEVNNVKIGDDNEHDNRVWMNTQPLKDEKGRVFRDSDGKESQRVELGDNSLYGSLQSLREFVTGKGEFSSKLDMQYNKNATTDRGVPYYRMSLDALANKFADMFNDANRFDIDMVTKAYQVDNTVNPPIFIGKDGAKVTYTDADGNVKDIEPTEFDDLAKDIKRLEELKKQLTENAKDKTLTAAEKEANRAKIQTEIDQIEGKGDGIEARTQAAYEKMEILRQKGNLNTEYAYYNGGVLFSNNGDGDDTTNITAANITISKSWSVGEVRILNSKKPDTVITGPDGEITMSHSTANDNIAHMVNLMGQKLDYLPKDADPNAASDTRYFNGTFQERFADMGVILAVDQQTTTTLYNSYTIKSLNLENDRQSVAGVDLNDEATNMMTFQKSYSAACQLMTTLDSMLERLINGTLR